MRCHRCGAEIPAYNTFCPNCGATFLYEFNRVQFKFDAREALRNTYWNAFLVCLIETILVGLFSAVEQFGPNNAWSVHWPAVVFPLSIFTSVAQLSLIYSIFVANPITVGSSKYFLNNRFGYGTIENIFYAFKGGYYLKIVGAMAWRALFTFLWTLLFVIPGIIKYYSYILVPYILADNPNIGYDKALKLSMDMTNGYKMEIFILQLSFIGWYLLGAICLGVGVLFVNPYYSATLAEMYLMLKDNAIKTGICSHQDLTPYPSST